MIEALNRHPERLPEIDALRGIAALCIVVFHFKVMTDHPGGLLGFETALGRWANAYLWTAVDLFFVISGFIFAHVYLRDGRLNPKTTMSGYAMARIARIYPLHLLTLMMVAAIVWAGVPLVPAFDQGAVRYDGFHFVLNLLMLQASGLERGFSFNSPAWSLTSEFVCYALFYALARIGGRWLLIGAMLAIAAGFVADVHPGLLPVPDRIARGLVGFFVGLLLYCYRVQLRRIPFVVTAAMALIMLVAAPALESTGVNSGVMMSLFTWPWLVLTCLNPVSGRLLSLKPMQFVGDLSYSIYLLHVPLALVFLSINGGRYFAIEQFVWVAPLYLAVLLIVAWLSFSRFEVPVRRRIRSIGASTPTA
jgi:peptidoglycan/LPS O-acetylase OafA/YrhL